MYCRAALLFAVTAAISVFPASCKNKSLHQVADPQFADIKLPEGFHISLFADSVNDARSLALGGNGTVFVGNREGDKIYALVDENKDGKADKKYVIVKDMNMPNGVAFRNGALYIAEVDKLWRIDNVEANLQHPPKPVLITDRLPHDKHHGWKFIAFGPDGKLYVPIGAPCNVCNPEDSVYASITRMNADGSGFEIFARGIRNTVGFDWEPQTNNLWFTDNGRDRLGDNIPPDELNEAPRKGLNFGFPFCHGGDIQDPEYGEGHTCNEFVPPVMKLGPHVAALGMRFYTGNMFPKEYRNAIFIAEHGSWNRSAAIGYRIMMVRKTDTGYHYSVFAEGWLKDGKAWGRPVDVLQVKDGSLLVSDDYGNRVYRITYGDK
jgi:glucose/arabinose dehydrogenase